MLAWGRLVCLQDGDGPLAWIATGSMARTARTAAAAWPGSAVWSAPSIKPLDPAPVAALCRRYALVVTLEEHSIHGGLGAAVAEIAAAHAPTWICRIGVPDRFSQCCGSYGYLLEEHRLSPTAVGEQVRAFMERLPRGAMATRTAA